MLYVEAGGVDLEGFRSVAPDSLRHEGSPASPLQLGVGDSYDGSPAPTESLLDPVTGTPTSLSVTRTSSRSLTVATGLYELVVDNSDRYVDLVTVRVLNWTALLHVVQPEGLMGCTWQHTAPMPPEEELYRERDNHLTGCNTQRDKHCTGRGAGAGGGARAAAGAVRGAGVGGGRSGRA